VLLGNGVDNAKDMLVCHIIIYIYVTSSYVQYQIVKSHHDVECTQVE